MAEVTNEIQSTATVEVEETAQGVVVVAAGVSACFSQRLQRLYHAVSLLREAAAARLDLLPSRSATTIPAVEGMAAVVTVLPLAAAAATEPVPAEAGSPRTQSL